MDCMSTRLLNFAVQLGERIRWKCNKKETLNHEIYRKQVKLQRVIK